MVAQGTEHQIVGLSPSKPAEVISLEASSCNPLTGWDQDLIIRETNERATREEKHYGRIRNVSFSKPEG